MTAFQRAPHERAGPPEAVQNISSTVKLLDATLKRARPNRIPASLRAQLVKLVSHWLYWRLLGAVEVYPGIARMAVWASASERQARSNMRILENWRVAVPLAYAKGGRRATRFRIDEEALFRVLVHLGCNPGDRLRLALVRNPEIKLR